MINFFNHLQLLSFRLQTAEPPVEYKRNNSTGSHEVLMSSERVFDCAPLHSSFTIPCIVTLTTAMAKTYGSLVL